MASSISVFQKLEPNVRRASHNQHPYNQDAFAAGLPTVISMQHQANRRLNDHQRARALHIQRVPTRLASYEMIQTNICVTTQQEQHATHILKYMVRMRLRGGMANDATDSESPDSEMSVAEASSDDATPRSRSRCG